MATGPGEYSKEQLNFFRICFVTDEVIAEGLREIFKKQWDKFYKASLGEWMDKCKNGMDFYNGESLRNQRKNKHHLTTMVKGNRAEWDCTMLFYAILYSDSIGCNLDAAVKSNVDDLRNFRNNDFAHSRKAQLSDLEFQTAITKVYVAFEALGLSTLQIREIRNQTSFETEELRKALKEIGGLEQKLKEKETELQEKEEQIQALKYQLKMLSSLL